MFCNKCGAENNEVAEICVRCGAKITQGSFDKNPVTTAQVTSTLKSEDTAPTIVTAVLLVTMYPIGFIVMWFWPKWKIWVKLLVSLPILAVVFLGILIAINPASRMREVNDSKRIMNQKVYDSKRIMDLDAIVKVMNLALENGEITLVTTGTCITCTSDRGLEAADGSSGWVKFYTPEGKTGLRNYIDTIPSDPVNSGEYVYTFASTPTGFEINAVLQDNAAKMSNDGGDDSSVYEVGSDLSIL